MDVGKQLPKVTEMPISFTRCPVFPTSKANSYATAEDAKAEQQ